MPDLKRHIKCDETKPSCLKCTRSGWKCDGYVTSKSTLEPSASDNNAVAAGLLGSALSITRYSIPFSIQGSQRDRQLLHYFCVQGSQELAGYLNYDFWTRTVLQESHRESAARQALVSLSSLHLDYITTTTPGNGAAGGETLTQYSKAIRALRKRLEKSSHEGTRTAIVCCVLFYCFEAALGNSEGAMHHLQSGLKLLSSHSHARGQKSSEDLDGLSRVFEGLDLQATLFDDERVPSLTLTTDKDRQTWISDMHCAADFARLEDAYQALVKLQNWLFHFLTKNVPYKFKAKESIPASIFEEKSRLLKQLNRWITKFDNMRRQTDQGDQATCARHTLLIHWQVSYMLLEADYPVNVAVFGASPNPQAEEIITLASNLLELAAKGNALAETAKRPRRNFSSETGVVAPLFMLAMKCSDEYVSNRAAELLAASQRREGLYDAKSMAKIVHQFRTVRQHKRAQSRVDCVENADISSLEQTFAHELDQVTGGMDRMADFIVPASSFTAL